MPYYEHPRAALTADIALFVGAASERRVLLICRGNDPFKGMWALPGGFVDEGERVIEAARRELLEETGVDWEGPLYEVGAFADPGRDPRGWTASVAWTALTSEPIDPHAGDDAADARWHRLDELPKLAFDHGEIIERALHVLEREVG